MSKNVQMVVEIKDMLPGFSSHTVAVTVQALENESLEIPAVIAGVHAAIRRGWGIDEAHQNVKLPASTNPEKAIEAPKPAPVKESKAVAAVKGKLKAAGVKASDIIVKEKTVASAITEEDEDL